MVDLITPVTSSSPLLDFAVSRANSNVATTFAGHNSGGNMQSQEAQTSISAVISQKMVILVVTSFGEHDIFSLLSLSFGDFVDSILVLQFSMLFYLRKEHNR